MPQHTAPLVVPSAPADARGGQQEPSAAPSADGTDDSLCGGAVQSDGARQDRPPAPPAPLAPDAVPDGAAAADAWRRRALASVEDRLTAYLALRRDELASFEPDAEAVLGPALDRACARGRRIRALLARLGWEAAGSGGSPLPAVLLGVALELLQACALVHDDLMDGSATRRGRPALHVWAADRHRAERLRGDAERHGRAQALLVGDLAMFWAEDLIVEAPFDARTRHRVRALWREARTEMAVGQQLDLVQAAGRAVTPQQALRTAELKTAGYTVARPLELGAAAAGASASVAAGLRAFGRRVGLAFQLRDDLAGLYGDPGHTGKPVGDDLREGKRTYLVTMGLHLARTWGDHAAERTLDRALGGGPDAAEADLDRARELLHRLGAVRAVEQHVARLLAEARAALDGVPLPAPVRLELDRIADQLAAC